MYQSAKETTSLPQRAALDVYLKTAPGGFRKAPTMKPRPTSPKLMPSTDYGPPPPPKPAPPPRAAPPPKPPPPPPKEVQWYYADSSGQQGPVPQAALMGLARSRREDVV